MIFVTREELTKMVEATTLVPSGKNQQALRYRLVTSEESDKVLPLIRLGAALPELHLPFPGTEPRAFLSSAAPSPRIRSWTSTWVSRPRACC